MEFLKALTSVTFRNLSAEEIVKLAVSSHLEAIEWGGDIHVPKGDFETAKNTKELCKKNNIKIISYGTYYKGLSDDFSEISKTAVALGAKVIRVWAGEKSPENTSQEEFLSLVKTFQNACDLAKSENVTIAFEYHRGTLTENKESAYKLLNQINRDNIACYWQPNPDISFEEQRAEIALLSPWIINFHVFAWTKGNQRHLLETAFESFSEYLKVISEKGKIPNLILEFVKDDSQENFVKDCKTLHNLTKNILPAVPKKQAIFLNNGRALFKVFDEKTMEKIKTEFSLFENVITSDNFCENLSLLSKVEVVFSTWGMVKLCEKEIEKYLPNLKTVFYAAGSVQEFARPYLNKNVKVFSAWAANAIPVAEYTVAQIILAGKGFYQSNYIYKTQGRKRADQFASHQPCNYNIKIGILGVGMIGKMVIERLQNFDFQVLAYDPFVSDETLKEIGAKRASLEEIFSSCQVVSNHIANLPATVGMINYKLLSLMQNYSTFINTGRGAQVVEDDLIKVLTQDTSKTAVLDVIIDESNERKSPFEELDNVFLTPHIAGSQGNEVARMGEYMFLESQKWLCQKPCEYEVSLKMLETMA